MNAQHKNINTQSGNILIYILGAIFLLGLLAITIKGSITPGAGIDVERLAIQVSEVQQYGQELEQAVAYIMANGHSESDIRFAHPDADSAYGDITDDPTRQVFSRDGGGASYRAPPSGVQTSATPWLFTGRNVAFQVGTDCGAASTECTDLIAFLGNVTKDFCLLLNEKNDIPNTGNMPPKDSGNITLNPFNGNFAHNTHLGDGVITNGKLEGCLEGDIVPPSGTYHYYRVLLAR